MKAITRHQVAARSSSVSPHGAPLKHITSAKRSDPRSGTLARSLHSNESKEEENSRPALTRRASLAAALVSIGWQGMSKAEPEDTATADMVVFDEASLAEAAKEAEESAVADAAAAAAEESAAADAAATTPAVSKITVQTSSSSSIDGQGSLEVLLSDDLELAEEELTVTQRQALIINRRTQKQNNVPPDFPLFARDGYDMTILVSNGYQVTDDGLLYKDYVVGTGATPSDGQQVTFDYTGYNESGGVIDSSYRKGAPSSMRIGVPGSTVVPGFELGVKTMAVGGKRRIVVPPELGPPVGPQTFFSAKVYEIFDVELRSSKTCVRRTVGMFSDVVCSDE
jgi:FKBP-type peptidyl-prolyl cis-trans isomerase